MMTQLKSYLLQSTELQAMLEPQHQYTQDKLGKFKPFDSLRLFLDVLNMNFAIWGIFSVTYITLHILSVGSRN